MPRPPDDTGQWLEPLAGYRVPKPTLEALRRVRLSLADSPFHAEAARTLRAVVSVDLRPVLHDQGTPRDRAGPVDDLGRRLDATARRRGGSGH